MGKQRRQFTEEFKRDAVRMMHGRGSRTVAEVADDLGIVPNLLHRWAQKLDSEAIAKRNADGETLDQEVRRLRQGSRATARREGDPKKSRAHTPTCVGKTEPE